MKRLVLLISGGVAVALGIIFVGVGLDRADKLASVVGAIAGVLGLGLATVGFRDSSTAPKRVTVTRSGSVRQSGSGTTVTGVHGRGAMPHSVEVSDSGEVDKRGDGDVTTGVRWT